MSINLRVWLGDLELTAYPYMLEYGMDLGKPENIYTVLNDLLADGEPVSSARSSNRQMALPVIIEGPDMLSMSEAEAALMAECEKSGNTLTIDPGDGFGPTTVFDTFRVQATQERDDEQEQAFLRRYSLEIQALPFARSASPTAINADAVSASVTSVDECQSTTGWSTTPVLAGYRTSSVSVDSTAGNFISGTGALKVTPSGTAVEYGGGYATAMGLQAKKSGLSVDASGGGYIIFSLKFEWPGYDGPPYIAKAWLTTSGGGTQEVVPFALEAQANGYVKYAILVPNNSTVTALELYTWQAGYGASPANHPAMWIDAIGFSGSAGSANQIRSFDVGGSMRTEGTLAVSATVGLGDLLLYTCPDLGDGFRPDMKRYQATGTGGSDVASPNGSYVSASTSPTFEAPTSMFRPGAYAVVAYLRDTANVTPGAVSVSAVTRISSTSVGDTQTATSDVFTLPDNADYYGVRVGVLDLPPLMVASQSTAKVRFTLTGPSSTRIGELLVFPLEDAALTWVRCGTGAPSTSVFSRVWIDAPSPIVPRGRLSVGTDAGRADARATIPMSRGRHMLKPGRMLAYVIASGSAGPSLTGSYFKRWHTNAAEDG